MCYQDLRPAYMNRAGSICQGDLRVVDQKRNIWGRECWPARSHYVYGSSIMHEKCVTHLLLASLPAGPVSMENFQLAQARSRHHNTNDLNKLLLLWTKQLCGCITRFGTFLWDPLYTRTTWNFLFWGSRRTWKRNFLSILLSAVP